MTSELGLFKSAVTPKCGPMTRSVRRPGLGRKRRSQAGHSPGDEPLWEPVSGASASDVGASELKVPDQGRPSLRRRKRSQREETESQAGSLTKGKIASN